MSVTATLPSYTRSIDTAFTQTWDKIRREVIDNVLNSTPVWAALKKNGCFQKQVGGRRINRNVRYNLPDTSAVQRGDTFPVGVSETITMAQWRQRWLTAGVNRSIFDDQENAGEYQIRSYVEDRLQEARDSLAQQYEVNLFAAETTDESGKNIQSLFDMIPAVGNKATGTYGGIARSNTWWQAKYRQLTAPYDVNLLSDMKTLYNNISLNMEPPDLIVVDQNLWEIYEDFALDQSQLVKDNSTYLADLGFEVLRFKGKPLVWSPNITANNALMLNTKYIEVVYDPRFFFQMGSWKGESRTEDQVSHILCCLNIVSGQLRRHGRLYA